MNRRFAAALCVAALYAAVTAYAHNTRNEWGELVQVQGHALPVPRVWLTDDEARFAHDLKLPVQIPRTVPFDFDRAKLKSLLPWIPSVSEQYFNHLCATEAGEWILKTAQDVEGLYFARPAARSMATQPFGRYVIEAPHFESNLAQRAEDSLLRSGAEFVSPPFVSYQYVEEPRRDVGWQAHIKQPYIRIWGLRYEEVERRVGEPGATIVKMADMQVSGIPQPTARYGYTWRGAPRLRDREFGVGGTEVMIFDRSTNEIMAVRRTFTRAYIFERNGQEHVQWFAAGQCPQTRSSGSGWERLARLAVLTLQTKEKSIATFQRIH